MTLGIDFLLGLVLGAITFLFVLMLGSPSNDEEDKH
jgi:hypothetical protein